VRPAGWQRAGNSDAPQEKRLIPNAEHEKLREPERQFRELVEIEDEAGYWAWLSLQPTFDPESPAARKRAAEAWREALGAKRSASGRR
jgi:hypothetical protein